MSRCPNDTLLHRLVDNQTSTGEQAELEAHLSDCAACRDRLESLTNVENLEAVALRARHDSTSPTLRLAMDRLTAEVFLPPLDPLEPVLEPSSRGSFLGRLGDLEIRREVGRGGMGVVYEALDPTLNRKVAVKTLSPHLLGDAMAKARFVREAQAAAALTHENVVAIHAISEAAGRPYLVLQFIEGESLAQRLNREGRLPFEEVVRLGMQAAKGLAAAHERGLIHRDIKPGNLMLDRSGTLRIADFGLARQMNQDSITEAGSFAGTPAFMSPEQIAGMPLDARSDLFSLGVTLYYASTGVLPFAAESPFAVADQVRQARPKPLREVNPNLPAWFCRLVECLMEKEPERRPASAAEVAELLERRRAPRALSTARRWWVALAAACALLLGLLVIWQERGSGRPTPYRYVQPRRKGFQLAGSSTLMPTIAEAVAAAPDGGTIEVHGDGPYLCDGIKLEKKSLTIVAAAGSVPRFEPTHAALSNAETQFLSGSGHLRLEGLEIIWSVPRPSERLADPEQRAVVSSSGKLELHRCRIVGGTMSMGVGSRGRELLVKDCHIVAERGVCIAWQPGPGAVRVENCILEGRYGMLVAQNSLPRQELGTFTAKDCSFFVERGLLVLSSARGRVAAPVVARGCLWDCEVMASIGTTGGPGQRLSSLAEAADALRESVAWSESGNLYRQGCVFLATARTSPLALQNQAEFRRLDQWLGVWKLPQAAATCGIIRLATRAGSTAYSVPRVAMIETAAGPFHQPVGARPDDVGPAANLADR